MPFYVVRAQGYGGSGPSVSPFVSENLDEIKEEIADLIQSDHAVQLYKIAECGTESRVEYYTHHSVTVIITLCWRSCH
jgi:hypothetical protein